MASTLLVTGVLTTTAATVSNGGGQFNGTQSHVGVDDTGYDVKFFGATTGKSLLWDESADSLIVTGTTTLVGTTNLDAVDIDGATQIDATVTVGVDDTGYDVKFFGATAGKYMLWDESADTLEVSGTVVAAAGTALLPSITTTGDLNTGMWFPAADTIAFSEGGVEALRIDSSGNVLVGKTAANFTVAGHELNPVSFAGFTRGSGAPVVVNRLTDDGALIELYSGVTTVGSIGTRGGDTVIASTSQGVRFYDANNVLLPTDGVGAGLDATISLGQSDGRWKDLYLSGGVYLGGTVAANKLDDYEEGTWDPIDASGQSLTFSGVVAEYTKVGKLVTASFNLTYPGSAGSAYAAIGGLPFTTSSTADLNWGGFSTYSSVGYAIGYVANINSTSFAPYAAIDYAVPPNNTAILGKTFRGVIVYRTT
jgi:hypothetical protein